MKKNKVSWSDWDQELRKNLYARMGESVAQLYNDISTRDMFHDMYERGLTPLDALQQYIVKGVPQTKEYRIA